jgi:DNA invertase Pin-like site-specific DNA recombinase
MADMGTRYDVLVAWALDRVTRKGIDEMAGLFRRMEETGGRIVTHDFDSAGSEARILGTLVSELSRGEMAKLSERICRGKDEQRRRGEYLGGMLSYGWQAIRRPNEPTQVELDPEVVPVIREMVDRLIAGATLAEVCYWANEAGHRTSTGAPWGKSTLARLVRSQHLLGYRRYGDDIYRDDDGNPVQVVDPIITEGQFVRVDRILASRCVVRGPRLKSNGRPSMTLLSGLIFCADCGGSMRRSGKAAPALNTYYRCEGVECGKAFLVRMPELDTLVAGEALAFLARQDKESPIVDEVGRRWLARYTPDQMTKRQELEDEVEAIEGRLRKLRTDYYDSGKMTDAEFDEREERLQGRVDDLRAEVGTMPAPTADLSAIQALVDSNDNPDLDPVSEGSAWANLEPHDRRDIIKLLIDSVVIERRDRAGHDIETTDNGGRVSITFATPSNVVELGARSSRRRRYSTAVKLAGFEGASRATVAATA